MSRRFDPRYGAPFETKGCNIISDVPYLYTTSDIQYQTSARARARARVRVRARTRAGIRRLR